ncbi:MAG: hypothetical protein HY270_05390 [Deltaproteobacteria bacterium]|nr:hypothetical protein [Deltaproteobacteria bacterium]
MTLHAGADARTLAFVRIWVFAIWLSRLLPDCFSCLAEFSPSLFARLGILRLIPNAAVPLLLRPGTLAGIQATLLVLLLLSLLGVRPYRVFASAAAILLTLYEGVLGGFAQGTHSDLALLFVTYVLAIVPAADAVTWGSRKGSAHPAETYAAAMIMMALLLLMTYSLVAFGRVALSSPEIFLSPTMRFYIASDILRPTRHPFLLGEWLLVHPLALWLAQVGFGLVTVFELTAPLCLIHKRWRYAWLAVMSLFHVASYLFMNVLFLSNILLFPVLLLEPRELFARRSDPAKVATTDEPGAG